jgi:hypothetical protein
MKDKVFLILGAFVLLTGCASAQAGGNASVMPATAAQLARELNAMSEGSATANGDTVTLTGDLMLIGDVWVEKSLIVSAGVTFDLTADGARLFLKDGATLTVNGTVNVRGGGDHGNGWVDGGLCIEDGASVINGNGTINLTSKGRLISIWSGDGVARKLTLDGVTLVGISDNDESLVWAGEGAELVLVSGAITDNTTSQSGAGVKVENGSTFTMSGGAISGNSAEGIEWTHGGGVFVGGGGTFIMTGGAISGNTAVGTSTNGGGSAGGVFVGGTFTMKGGAISGNNAYNPNLRDRSGGGGVNVQGGTFSMEDGEISGNTVGGGGGGVVVNPNSVFIMSGGVIFGNASQQQSGGGIAVFPNGTFTMSGGMIQGSTDSDGFIKNSGALRVDGSSATARWGTGGTYTRGGVNQPGGGNIASTNDTLIAIPAR